MLAFNILGTTAEEGQCDRGLDVFVSIDGRGDGLDDALADAVVTRKGADLLLVFFCQTEGGEEVLFLIDVIRFDDGGEDGEAVLGVQRRVEVVTVDARDFLDGCQ